MSSSTSSRPHHLSSPISPRNGTSSAGGGGGSSRFESNGFPGVLPTSSLRDPPPGESRSPSFSSDGAGERDDFLAHQTRGRRGRRAKDDTEAGEEGYDEESSSRADKRRKLGRPSRPSGLSSNTAGGDVVMPSPSRTSQHSQHSMSPVSPHGPSSGRFAGLPPIKPIGFAASRESRREDGGNDLPIPSPVVMGFDFKSIDEEQLKTVRDTINIREQQQALIAKRRKENAASTPSTPKELTFKGWVPKEPSSAERQGVGRRREKTRDKVEGMSIITSAGDKDVVPGSKSAPLNQNLSSQQVMGDPPMGPQTSIPHVLPPMHHAYGPDPRTAPVSHARGSRGEEHEFARQQGNGNYWRINPRQGYERYDQHPHTARPSVSQFSEHRRHNTMHGVPQLQPPPAMPRDHQPHPYHSNMSDRNGGSHADEEYDSATPSPPPGIPRQLHHNDHYPRDHGPEDREHRHPPGPGPAYLPNSAEVYDLFGQAEQARYNLQELLHRYQTLYADQVNAMGEFKSTANQASALLGNLQASADSLKDMVRYEVSRAGSADKKEIEELRERVRILEEKLKEKDV